VEPAFVSLHELTAPFRELKGEIVAQLQAVLGLAREKVGAERGCLLLTLTGREQLLYDGDESLRLKFPFSRQVVGQVMVTGIGMVSFQEPGTSSRDSMSLHGVRAALCAPILAADEDLGIIYFDSRINNDLFNQEKLQLIQDLGRSIGSVIGTYP
jgi:GAF domain-containing protein